MGYGFAKATARQVLLFGIGYLLLVLGDWLSAIPTARRSFP